MGRESVCPGHDVTPCHAMPCHVSSPLPSEEYVSVSYLPVSVLRPPSSILGHDMIREVANKRRKEKCLAGWMQCVQMMCETKCVSSIVPFMLEGFDLICTFVFSCSCHTIVHTIVHANVQGESPGGVGDSAAAPCGTAGGRSGEAQAAILQGAARARTL